MKIKLRNILLTIPLALSFSCATLDKTSKGLSYAENTSRIIQNALLIKSDIYDYTKVALEDYYCEEANPIAYMFFENGQWDLCYAVSVGATIVGNNIAYDIDKSGNLAKIVNKTITLAEVLAIYCNSKLLTSKGWKDNSSSRNMYIEVFRWNY